MPPLSVIPAKRQREPVSRASGMAHVKQHIVIVKYLVCNSWIPGQARDDEIGVA